MDLRQDNTADSDAYSIDEPSVENVALIAAPRNKAPAACATAYYDLSPVAIFDRYRVAVRDLYDELAGNIRP